MDMEPTGDGIRTLEKGADLFYALRVREAMGMMENVARNVETVLKLNQAQDAAFHELVLEINQLLHLLLACLENRDYILAADVLKYELVPRLNAIEH